MAFKHGKDTRVYLNAVDLSTYLMEMGITAEADMADTTTFAATWKNEAQGTLGATVPFSGLYDDTDTTLKDAFWALSPGVLTYCPGGGAAVGDRARLVSAFDVSHGISVPVGGMVAVSGSFKADAAVGFGDILHPLGQDTGTTTGSSKDELAATATGWTAHLHVIAVSSGSWVVTIEDSSTGSSGWATVTGATFTAATAATSQRLVASSTTAAVKQYVRYVATVTGGSSPTIMFALAFARNR
jgi:hypothetical protein